MKTLEEYKFEMVVERLIMFEGNRTKAAESLGISQRGLRYIISRILQDDPELHEKIPQTNPAYYSVRGDAYAQRWEDEQRLKQKK